MLRIKWYSFQISVMSVPLKNIYCLDLYIYTHIYRERKTSRDCYVIKAACAKLSFFKCRLRVCTYDVCVISIGSQSSRRYRWNQWQLYAPTNIVYSRVPQVFCRDIHTRNNLSLSRAMNYARTMKRESLRKITSVV